MTEAERHAADAQSAQEWSSHGQAAFRNGHPDNRPAISYRHFKDGSFVQATVSPDGSVELTPGVSYDDAKAQSGELYDQRVADGQIEAWSNV